MSEMKNAVGAGTGRSGDDLCAGNSVREFKIWADVLNYGKKILKNAGIVEADLDAWYLFGQIFGISRAQYFLCARENIVGSTAQKMTAQEQTGNSLESKNALDCVELWLKEKLSAYENTLEKRASRVPLQQILGQQEFMGLTFFVNEHVLIPRQDTETLVEEALKKVKPGMKVLDMCTGSGCIIISILHNVEGVKGYAVDISKQAVNVAKENAKLNEVPVLFERSDLFEMVTEKFDVIVSNPPYIPTDVIPQLMPEVQVFEPVEALDGKEDGLYFYRKIVEQSKDYLNSGGSLMFEIGYDQGKDVSKMMTDAGFSNVCVKKDLAGNDRVVTGML